MCENAIVAMPPKARKHKNGFAALGAKLQKALRPVPPERKPELPYPRSLLKAAEARAGFVAIYVVAPREQAWPISFGITSDPAVAYHSYQKGYWQEHAIHELQWTPGRPAAERVKRAMTHLLAPRKRGFWSGWHDATVDEGRLALIAAARQEGVMLFDDVEKQRKLHKIALRAWEMKVGVERIEIEAPPKAEKPSGVIIPLHPKRQH